MAFLLRTLIFLSVLMPAVAFAKAPTEALLVTPTPCMSLVEHISSSLNQGDLLLRVPPDRIRVVVTTPRLYLGFEVPDMGYFNRLLIVKRDDSALIGRVSLNIKGPGVAETAIYLQHTYRENGYAFEALSALAQHAFNSMGVQRIEAQIDPENSPSLGLHAKLGFHLERPADKFYKLSLFVLNRP